MILGAANQAGEDNRNVARMAILLAGLPVEVPGYTVNRLCVSGAPGRRPAAQQIRSGEAEIVVAGGVESMTRAPSVVPKPDRPEATAAEIADTTLGWRLVNPRMRDVDGGKATITLGETAEKVAIGDGITREESDAFGLRSQRLAAVAAAGRRPRGPRRRPAGRATVDADEVPRPDTTAEAPRRGCALPSAPTAIVTAGSASPLADGAAAIVVAGGPPSSATASRRVRGSSRPRRESCRPRDGSRAGPSTERVLTRAGWTTGDLDAIEINEAFAPQVIASVRRLGLDPERVNADGGAIASDIRWVRAVGWCRPPRAGSSGTAAGAASPPSASASARASPLLVERPS